LRKKRGKWNVLNFKRVQARAKVCARAMSSELGVMLALRVSEF